ncbi:hypothetical protein [Kaistella haifensis]|nr:hypothetical protein [Kaistella haifensis]
MKKKRKSGGQFKPNLGGQFAPKLGGQFDRFFHLCYEPNILIVHLMS